MTITYADSTVEAICTDTATAQRRLGDAGMKRLRRRVKELESAETWPDVLQGPGRWHPLKGYLAGTHSATVTGSDRILVQFVSGTAVIVLQVGDIYQH